TMAGRRHYIEVRVLYGKDASVELNEWAAKGYKIVVATADRIIMEAKVKEKDKDKDKDKDDEDDDD
ncbi:MAG TPA: hypothetical protein VEZ44_14005, partial [bacterium]|nr:hypothetical protein [bacterium]